MNRKDIRQRLGHYLNACHVGTVSTSSATSFVDVALIDFRGEGNEKLEAAWVKNNHGEVRRVRAYDDDSGQVTLGRAWTPASGEYELHTLLSPDDLDTCINRTLARCYHRTEIELELTDERQYPLEVSEYPWLGHPSQVQDVYFRQDQRLRPVRWWVVEDRLEDGEFVLHIRPVGMDWGDAYILKCAKPYDQLEDDEDETTCPVDWVEAGAAAEAYRLLARHAPAQDASRYRALQTEAIGLFMRKGRKYSPRAKLRPQHPDTPM